MNRHTIALALAVLPVLALIGCGDTADGRRPVSGTVKFKGQPIKDGAIVLFEPLDNQGTAQNVAVSGGKFTIPRENGLKPGRYLVRVTAGDGKTAVNPVDPDAPPGPGGTNIISKDLVPKDWNVNSKQEVTVTKDGANKFDFDIP
ncbi:MAG: hypothetical protein J2P46_15290 [Zavarzinella sp.]|nr:hypothetical protein [Zavarzinella sp.]